MVTSSLCPTGGLAYAVNRWQRYLYEEAKRHHAVLPQLEEQGDALKPRYAEFQREVFARLINAKTPPLETVEEENKWAVTLHGLVNELPEFSLLQKRCRGDEVWSALATSCMSKNIVAKIGGDRERALQEIDRIQKMIAHLQILQDRNVNVDRRLSIERRSLRDAKKELKHATEGIVPAAIRGAVREACNEAQKAISQAEDSIDALTFGDDPGVPCYRPNADRKRALAEKLANSKKLQKIAELAGRLRRMAVEKQRTKTDESASEVSQLEQGADVERLLPTEFCDFLDPDREALFFSRLLERQCIQYQLKGKEKKARGPLVLAVDESGSMRGTKEEWSKAVMLALLDVAIRQKRSWAVIHFSGEVTRVDVKDKKQGVDHAQLMQCLEHFSGGDTNIPKALKKGEDIIIGEGNFKEADIVLITDGIAEFPPAWIERFMAWKKEKHVSLFTIQLDVGGKPHWEARQSGRALILKTLSDIFTQNVGDFEQSVLAI